MTKRAQFIYERPAVTIPQKYVHWALCSRAIRSAPAQKVPYRHAHSTGILGMRVQTVWSPDFGVGGSVDSYKIKRL